MIYEYTRTIEDGKMVYTLKYEGEDKVFHSYPELLRFADNNRIFLRKVNQLT